MLRRFDPALLPSSGTIVIVDDSAQRTLCARDVLWHYQALKAGIVVSAERDYEEHVPEVFVYKRFDRDVLRLLVERHERVPNAHGFCRVDPCNVKDPSIRALAMRCKELSILAIFAADLIPLTWVPDVVINQGIVSLAHQAGTWQYHAFDREFLAGNDRFQRLGDTLRSPS